MLALKNKFKNQKIKLKHLSARVFNSQSLVLSQTTLYEIIERYKHCTVRYYASPNKQFKEPLVFTAPLAINMSIYDLYPYRSLVKHFQHSGFDVYLLEWNKLSYQDRHLNFMSFIDDALPHCINFICKHAKSEQVSLHGWSMAGIFVTLYTALHNNKDCRIKNLMVLGSPIDSYASGRVGKLFKNLNQLISQNKIVQKTLYQGQIPKHFIHTPGLINALGFKIMDPKGWFDSQKSFLLNLESPQSIYEHATMGQFLNNMIDYPGGINQDMVLNLWLQNPLKQGVIQLQDKVITLKNISCPLMVGAGSSDQIVTAEASKPLIELTNSKDVTFTLIPGGHLGLMSSQKSANTFWPKLTDWLTQRSTLLETKN
ncbi:alpha/beta fold hydrolase [Acinetobacter tianfuensis]|uniref:Alpha/beta fold hydrolase n=1 Tax=Acinetobacter tianfuensis TaxID=2419603 RepID=A0A3A8ETD0_9GAMM|nr:alpha/beta fold hydrolase [Acinetobacter tianfuensis]RKG33960.1 alpha/beta fold hydrolase [Acinetobacter tianfuensis]